MADALVTSRSCLLLEPQGRAGLSRSNAGPDDATLGERRAPPRKAVVGIRIVQPWLYHAVRILVGLPSSPPRWLRSRLLAGHTSSVEHATDSGDIFQPGLGRGSRVARPRAEISFQPGLGRGVAGSRGRRVAARRGAARGEDRRRLLAATPDPSSMQPTAEISFQPGLGRARAEISFQPGLGRARGCGAVLGRGPHQLRRACNRQRRYLFNQG